MIIFSVIFILKSWQQNGIVANLKHSVKAMVAWHMRIFCCETFFCQNSHTNFIEPRTRCNKNRMKFFQIQFKMVRCFFEEIKVLLLLACCRNVKEKIEDIFQSHFNAVKKHLHFQLDDFLLGLVIQSFYRAELQFW